MTDNTELRAAFEKWFRENYHDRLDRNMPDKSYNDPTAYTQWPAYQAARLHALAAPLSEVGHVTVPFTRGGLEVGEAEVEWSREFAALTDGNPGQRFTLYAALRPTPSNEKE